MEAVVRNHLHWLVACSNNVRTESRNKITVYVTLNDHINSPAASFSLCMWSLPFVIFAGESTIDKFTDGSRVINVIQNYYQRYFRCAGFPIYLISQVRKIKLQILQKERRKREERESVMEDDSRKQTTHQIIHGCIDPHGSPVYGYLA